MKNPSILYHDSARERLQRGITALAEAVRVTLGPRGRTVIIEREFGPPQIVNSGVVVARAVHLPDAFENMGAQLLREVAARTSELAGDGTTTATVLAHSMVQDMAALTGAKVISEELGRRLARAAVDEGIVPGGGVALLRARRGLDALQLANLDENSGVRVIARSLEEPLRRILINAATRSYGDLLAMGVIDPAKVTRLALQNAGSIASLILSIDCMIAVGSQRTGTAGPLPGADLNPY
jgi:chaperonin GroEL (HSP60 family)